MWVILRGQRRIHFIPIHVCVFLTFKPIFLCCSNTLTITSIIQYLCNSWMLLLGQIESFLFLFSSESTTFPFFCWDKILGCTLVLTGCFWNVPLCLHSLGVQHSCMWSVRMPHAAKQETPASENVTAALLFTVEEKEKSWEIRAEDSCWWFETKGFQNVQLFFLFSCRLVSSRAEIQF